MEDKQGIKAIICIDHFTRLCNGETCDTCPSKPEHERAVRELALLQEKAEEEMREGNGKVLSGFLSEIRQLRSVTNRLVDDQTKLEHSVLGDGNGIQGLKTKVLLLEYDKKKNSSAVGTWIAVASALTAIIALLITLVQAIK